MIDKNKIGTNKYATSPIDSDLSADLIKTVDEYMHSSQTYLENGLTLERLAKQLNLTKHHLSQVINQQSGSNFYEYVNAFRVDYATKQISQYPGKSITTIAFDAGFNNRVSFINAFKKIHGITPTEFRKSIQQSGFRN